jgi:RNA polymerase sigma factor (sigma-70 family)
MNFPLKAQKPEFTQLSLPFLLDDTEGPLHLLKDNTKPHKKEVKQNKMVIVDELLDTELEKIKQETQENQQIEERAWQWTLDVDKWIWKQIRDRGIPDQDWNDVYNLCIIEVFNLMKRYNPKYSKVSWANFGILKALKEYESTSGTIRLPFHVLEKMATLRKFIAENEVYGAKVSQEEMSKVTSMKITDILVAKDRYAFISSVGPEGNVTEFSETSLNVDKSCTQYVNSGDLDPEKNAIDNDETNWLYANLSILNDVEIYILCLRFGLTKENLPNRDSFKSDREYDITWHLAGECYKFNDIGKKIGITRERVRQIEIKAIEKVKSRIELEKRYDC